MYKFPLLDVKPASCNFASLPGHAQLRSDHSDKFVPEEARQHGYNVSLFTQLAGQNRTRLVARFDWDQRFVTEPPSY